MRSVVARRRRVLVAVGSLALGAGLTVTVTPSAGTAAPAAGSVDRPVPAAAPAGPGAKALSHALPARLGTLTYTSVYGATKVTSSTGKKLTISLSAFKQQGGTPSFSVSLSRGQSEQHAWRFPAPNSAFDISANGTGELALTSGQTGGMGKVAVKVKPDGALKSEKCGGEVYAKSRNVIITGKTFFDTKSKWGKVGSKTKSFKFRTTHRSYLSYDVTCPPIDYPDPCYTSLSWSSSRSTSNTFTYISATKDGAKSSVYAYRTTELAKPDGASRTDAAWGTGDAPDLTVAPDDSASMKIHGVKGSGRMADPNPGSESEDDCDTGTQHLTSWWSGTVTNDDNEIKVPAQVFGAFTVPDGSDGYMSRATFD